MRRTASAHDGAPAATWRPPRAVAAAEPFGGRRACATTTMTRNDTQHDPAEPAAIDQGYACIETGDGVLVYDPDRQGAWIQSDTALNRTEVR